MRYCKQAGPFLAVILTLGLATNAVIAAVLGITSTPVDLVLGTSILIVPNLTGNTDPIVSTTWSSRKHFPNGLTTPWNFLGDIQQSTLFGEVPITYEMKLETTYGSVPGLPMPHAPTTHYRSWTVNPANGVRDFDGFEEDAPIGNSIEVVYWVKSGTQDCGPYITGLAQEKLTNRFLTGFGVLPPWNHFYPLAPGPTFRLYGGRIWDEHSATTTYWNVVPTPGLIESAIQELKIVWSDPTGQLYDQPLGNQQIIHRKVSQSQWQVTH